MLWVHYPALLHGGPVLSFCRTAYQSQSHEAENLEANQTDHFSEVLSVIDLKDGRQIEGMILGGEPTRLC